MSFETTIRPVLTSHKRSHDFELSKIRFVTPAMYPGLYKVKEGGNNQLREQ